MPTEAGAKVRVGWIDYVKGLVIAYVVFRHVNDGLKWQSGDWAAATDSLLYWYHDKYPMAAFFFLSGLFARRAVDRPYKGFLVNRLLTGVYRYVLWVTLFTVLQVALSAHTNNPGSFQPIREMLYDPPFHYWFLYALVLISVIWVGMRNDGAVQRFAQAPVWKLAAIPAACVAVIAVTTPLGFQEPYIGLLILTLCTLPITFALGIVLDRYNLLPFIKRWGALSLEIYVAHIFGTAGARIALQKIFGVDHLIVHLVIGMIAGLYLPILLVVITERLHVPYLFRLEPRRVIRARAALARSAGRTA